MKYLLVFNAGEVKKKDLLYQYNEEIDGEKKESFTLEGGGTFNEEQNKARELAKVIIRPESSLLR